MIKDSRIRVLFVCVGNACRSPMAEAIARHDASDTFEAFSAGLLPAGFVAGMTELTLVKNECWVDGLESKGILPEVWKQADIVINMSGRRRELAFPEYSKVRDWEIEDPIGKDLNFYQQVFDKIRLRIAELTQECRQQNAAVRVGERRARKRLNSSLIFVTRDDLNNGLVFNITEDGMALSAAKPLFANERIAVRIQFPDFKDCIELTGQIAWKRSNKEIGVRFVGLTDEGLQRIRSWIDRGMTPSELHSEVNETSVDLEDKALPRIRNWVFTEAARQEPLEQPADGRHGLRPVIEDIPSLSSFEQTSPEENRILDSSPSISPPAPPRKLEPVTKSPRQQPQEISENQPTAKTSSRVSERRYARVQIIPFGCFQSGQTNGGIALNISEGGVAITAGTTLADDLPSIRLRLPDTQDWIEARGQIVWKSTTRKEAGVRFEGLTDEAQQRIREWIAVHAPLNEVQEPLKEIPQRQERRQEFCDLAEPVAFVSASSTAGGNAKQFDVGLSFASAANTSSQDTDNRVKGSPTSAPPRGLRIKRTIRRRVQQTHVQRGAAVRRPSRRAFAALLIFAGIFLMIFKWILPRRSAWNASTASVAEMTKVSSDIPKNPTTPPVPLAPKTVTTGPPTKGVEEENPPPSKKVEPLVAQKENDRGHSRETSYAQNLIVPSPTPKRTAKALSRTVRSVLPQGQPRRQSLGIAATLNYHPFQTASPTTGGTLPAPPELGAKNSPTNLAPLPLDYARSAEPKSKESAMVPAKQQALPANLAGSVVIVADPYPSIRLPDARSSKKQNREASLQLGHLLSGVEPVYPEEAKQQGIQGTVKLHAVIGRHGSVQNLESIDGPPILVAAAKNAVRQWRYSETLLAGQSVETEEDIAVTFRLSNPSASKK